MAINNEVLNKLLLGLTTTDIITVKAKEEIIKYIETGDLNDISYDTGEELYGIYKLTLAPAYNAITGDFLPNIFIKEDRDNA